MTARKQIEQRLAEQARLLDLSKDAIIVRDLDQRVVSQIVMAEAGTKLGPMASALDFAAPIVLPRLETEDDQTSRSRPASSLTGLAVSAGLDRGRILK